MQAEADVEMHKDKLKEATKHYENAVATDPGFVSVPLEGPEVVRTRTLMEQAQRDLEEAEVKLKDLKKNPDEQ